MNGARLSSFVLRGRHTWRPYDGNGTPRRGDALIARTRYPYIDDIVLRGELAARRAD